ncbi:NAD(+) diphosphatase [Marinobacteraceae bacterium S3BR75-40.1]
MSTLESVWHLDPPTEDALILRFQGPRLLWREPSSLFWSREEVEESEEAPLLVGRLDGRDVFAWIEPDREEGELLRRVLMQVDDVHAALLSTAMQLLSWRRDHRYCGRCARPTAFLETERALYCEHCHHRHFPRVSPCVIVAIRRGDSILLAESVRAQGQFYSLIAGFIEPGESAEEAVAREVAEETGLEVRNIRYQESQPWPFPHQLMLGYVADYAGGELRLQEDELVRANWFTADDLPTVPGEWTIAGRLIRQVVNGVE